MRRVSGKDLYAALDALHHQWSRGGSARAAFLETGPEVALGLSRPMIEWAIDRFAARLDPEAARAREAFQLGAPRSTGAGRVRIEPLGVLLLVVSGNVFTGPAEALLAALLTRNVPIVKRPSLGGEFLEAFCQSLSAVAPALADATTVLAWPGGTTAIERAFAEAVDGIVIAGDGETIAAYRRLASPHTVLLEFGPRVSVAVISRAGALRVTDDPQQLWTGLARDVARWDQLACSAAQNVYVEGQDLARAVAEHLASALADLAVLLPEGVTSLDERIEVARARQIATFAEALGESQVFAAGGGLTTVVFERDPELNPSPLRRSVRVKAFDGLGQLAAALAPTRGILHTAGLAVDERERPDYEDCLAAAGVRRICRIGCMNEPSPVGPHDGVFELQRLVRWIECV